MQVRWSPQAAEDLAGIVEYIRKDSADGAQRAAKKIYERAEELCRFPNLGRLGRLLGTRELPVPDLPFVLVYRVRNQAVEISTVLHGSRRWP